MNNRIDVGKMNKFLGMTWEELEHEIFTPEEIEASEKRFAPIIAEIKNNSSRTENFFNRETAQVAIKEGYAPCGVCLK